MAGSGCWFEGDFDAELFELVDELLFAPFGIETSVPVVVAHLVVGGVFVEHPPGHHEQVVADSEDRPFGTAAFGQGVEAGTHRGVLRPGR